MKQKKKNQSNNFKKYLKIYFKWSIFRLNQADIENKNLYLKEISNKKSTEEIIMTKKDLLKSLEEAENNKTEIMQNLKETEVFRISKFMRAMMLLCFLGFAGFEIYNILFFSKYFDKYQTTDFLTPDMCMHITTIFAMLMIIGVVLYLTIKINLEENYIKVKFKKIYFDNIIKFEIRENGTTTLTEKNGRVTIMNMEVENYGKLMLVIKEKIGKEKVTVEENPKYSKGKEFIKYVFIILLINFVCKFAVNLFLEK